MTDLASETARVRMDLLERSLRSAGFHVLTRALDTHCAIDLALALTPRRLAVVRRVDRATAKDVSSIATMISQGDFIWGAVVYNQGEAPSSPGLIESFHVSQLDQLVARLKELQEASREAG